ncbi:hypothetical protein OGR47_04945 [Methylocystis sp. MJC1]|jgi:hypothetical protein|uniref:hypothetical protein n=1 Tax=Methylocystis sp. MJC1 TaxID=2654282 RepID=UPI0013EA4607|nr:hypothetical protein [Methylocystis sp. MJC1]KAF2989755.1 hypothetical protein MJC1_03100 [Methylocystis sp. MJC1]MBU6526356.1 hypothetical protein [Methylocystis sp. MJC1]UZX12805.1 hypothetical protein OGR47_04945 [Methylocystis sp. MJC1]
MIQRDSDFDPRAAALRARIGWICKAVNVGAVLLTAWGIGLHCLAWSDRAHSVSQLARQYQLDPASVTEFGLRTVFVLGILVWLLIGALAWAISRLTRGYLAGEIFSISGATRMRHVAFAAIAVVVADILLRPMAIAALAPALFGKLPLYVWVPPFDLLLALFAAFVLILATIFKTATTIAAEHRQFI